MAVLSWGKPTVEFAVSEGTSTPSSWTTFASIVNGTTQLETTEGQLIEATEEGGDVVDSRREKNKYKLSLELFVTKGSTKPIPDSDGRILQNYAVRLTPEDPSCPGFIIPKANVTIIETYTSADGMRWRYIFDAIKPGTGALLQSYTKGGE